MEIYHFVTRWFFRVPVQRVWEEVKNLESYPNWWHSFKSIKVRGPQRELQLGSIADCEVRAILPYTLRFTAEVTRYEPSHIIEIRSSGDLAGTGKWVLEAQEGGTMSTFYWDVGTTSRVLNFVAKVPLVKTVLKKNHDNVMAEGYKVVRARLEG